MESTSLLILIQRKTTIRFLRSRTLLLSQRSRMLTTGCANSIILIETQVSSKKSSRRSLVLIRLSEMNRRESAMMLLGKEGQIHYNKDLSEASIGVRTNSNRALKIISRSIRVMALEAARDLKAGLILKMLRGT